MVQEPINESSSKILMKPKILSIIPDSINTPTGGMGVQFKNLYNILSKKFDFYISSFPDKPLLKNQIPVVSPFSNIRHGTLNTILGHSVYLYESLKHPKPDMVHAFDWSTYLAGIYLAKHHNVPLVTTIQLSAKALREGAGIYNCIDPYSLDGEWLHKMHEEIEFYGYELSEKIVCVSENYSEHFSQFKDKMEIIPNGINLEEWKKKNTVILPGKNITKVVYIGRFALMKSVDILASIDVPKDIDLIFVGDIKGGDPPAIQAVDDALKKENVFYIGSAYGQAKIDLLCQADAVIMPSRHEPFGIVALEAFASKSILLSSRIDGLGDFCNDSNSIYTSLTKEGMEKALNKLLQLTQKESQNLIANGIETCKKYTWESSAKKYEKLYKSTLNK